jgi:hypothetical protein
MLYPSTPCWQATPKTVLWPFQGWPTPRAGSLRPSSTPLNTPCCTPLVSTIRWLLISRAFCEKRGFFADFLLNPENAQHSTNTATIILMKSSFYDETRRKSGNGHRFPMPHLSRRGDKRVEMGHRLRRGRSPLISSYMDVQVLTATAVE